MAEILAGMIVMLALGWIILHLKRNNTKLRIGEWALVGFALLFSLFVMELIISFIREGAGRAALVMGGIFGFLAVILWVLISRLVLYKKSPEDED
jgi:hypothetical protein